MLPWPKMMRAAVSVGLSPQAFWQLSWREWRWLVAQDIPAMSRSDFEALCAAETPIEEESQDG